MILKKTDVITEVYNRQILIMLIDLPKKIDVIDMLRNNYFLKKLVQHMYEKKIPQKQDWLTNVII